VSIKTFSAHIAVKKCHVVRKMAGFAHAEPGISFERPARAGAEGGAGDGSRKGTHAVERTGGILRPALAHDMNSAPSPL